MGENDTTLRVFSTYMRSTDHDSTPCPSDASTTLAMRRRATTPKSDVDTRATHADAATKRTRREWIFRVPLHTLALARSNAREDARVG